MCTRGLDSILDGVKWKEAEFRGAQGTQAGAVGWWWDFQGQTRALMLTLGLQEPHDHDRVRGGAGGGHG